MCYMLKNKVLPLILALSLGAIQEKTSASGVGSIMGTGGASEMTQLMNNALLGSQLGQQVQAVSQLIQTYQTTYQQLQQMMLAGQSIQGVTLADVTRSQSDLSTYQNLLKSAGRDVTTLEQTFNTRAAEARLQNLTLEDYARREQERIAAGNTDARARIQMERRLLEQTNSDIVAVRRYGERIEQTVGVHESMGLMNSQMNLMLQQNSRMLTLTAQGQLSDKGKAAEDAEHEKAEARQYASQLDAAQTAQRAAERAAISNMRRQR